MTKYDIIKVIEQELNIKLEYKGKYYTSKNNNVYLREYYDGVFVVFKLTRKGIGIDLYKTIRTEKDLSNLIKLRKKVMGLR